VIVVNGTPVDCGERPTIWDVLATIDIDPQTAGIAVAVDAEIQTRSAWATRRLDDGAQVEIVTAVQGG